MHKQKIFIKIYLCFWVVTILALAIQITLGRLTNLRPPGPPPRILADPLALYGQAALAYYLSGKQAALENMTDRLRKTSGIRAYIIDQMNREITNHPLPPEAPALVARTRESGHPEEMMDKDILMMTVLIKDANGQEYALLGELPRKDFEPHWHHGFLVQIAFRLSVILIISGVIFHWLARYLISPVIALSDATRRFAAGELNVRIGKSLGKRKDELAELANDFDLMAERIESLMTLQRQLLGDISHELRSPLARLNVALELARTQPGPKAEKFLNRIGQEAESLNDMIGQLISLTRLEGGFGGIQMEPVDLTRLVREVVKDGDFEAQGSNRGVRLTESRDCIIHGNEKLLGRAIENVVRNAIRYTAEKTEVEISITKDEQQPVPYAVISVRDHGRGVPDTELGNMFRPFYRVSDARERETGGTGLGLAITDRAVRQHGGTIQAVNAAGGGLIIEIRLPAAQSPGAGQGKCLENAVGYPNERRRIVRRRNDNT
ncbi:MAG: HAMP domain-containing protein [Deltaproteobacteria bacterium]|nr:HAMP domain-containing protein [Deltaproteobacteria bacterium]